MATKTVPHPQERGTYLPPASDLSPVDGALLSLWQSAMDTATNINAGEGIEAVISILDAMRPLIASASKQCQSPGAALFAAPAPLSQAAEGESTLLGLWQSAMDAMTDTDNPNEGIDKAIAILNHWRSRQMRPLIASPSERGQPLADVPSQAPRAATQAAEAKSSDYPTTYDQFVTEVVDRITDVDAMIAGAAAIAQAGERVNYAAIILRELIPEKTEALRNWIDFSGQHYR